MFVLAHLSDPHLGPLPPPHPRELLSKRGLGFLNWLRKRRAIHRPEVLTRIVADLRAQSPDHTAVTGDLVNLSLSNEFAPARVWLETLGERNAVTFVPGNHDAYVRAAAGCGARYWGDYMRGDAGEDFPFVRRRGPLALIGLSTSLPTPPLAATGRVHGDQLARLGGILDALASERLFRVVLIHHPPTEGANYFRRLTDAEAVRDVLRRHGAELVLHGHHHKASLVRLPGPRGAIPCVGVPSASGAPGRKEHPAGYNLYAIEETSGDWRCTVIMRGFAHGIDAISEIGRQTLAS
jgi:3',5'-cyclic AMP phosphodiesterase CpdA